MLTAIVAIIIFALLVSAHEFGHFITAKLSGMYVQEFSIGMGPLVFAKQIGETKYSLRLLPLGGFVRVLGEDVEEEEDVIPPTDGMSILLLAALSVMSAGGAAVLSLKKKEN